MSQSLIRRSSTRKWWHTHHLTGQQPLPLQPAVTVDATLPVDADLVFDARCLPNPYWKPELRDHSGLDQPVIDYLAAQPEVEEMYQDILAYLEKWLPRFAASNRAYVTIAIGCTGGHHRSVYLANRLSQALKDSLKNVQVRHRDLS